MLGVDELVARVEVRAQQRAPADEVERRDVGDVAEGRPAARRSHRNCRHRRRRRSAARAPAPPPRSRSAWTKAGTLVSRTSVTCPPSCLYRATTLPAGVSMFSTPGVLGCHQPLLEGEGDGADGAVAAHRQAAGRLDVEEGDVAVLARRRIEDRPGHDVVAARLEHQARADPVVFRHEVGAPLDHRSARRSGGPPPVTTRTGLPQVWPSMQKKRVAGHACRSSQKRSGR